MSTINVGGQDHATQRPRGALKGVGATQKIDATLDREGVNDVSQECTVYRG